MSRIAKNSIKFSEETKCNFDNGIFQAKGKLGEMTININHNFTINIKDNEIFVIPKEEKNKKDPNWGTTRAIVANTIKGVAEGFAKNLELNGTGYRANVSGKILKLQLGYSHDIDYNIPEGVKIECPKQNIIKLSSHDKEKLGACGHYCLQPMYL